MRITTLSLLGATLSLALSGCCCPRTTCCPRPTCCPPAPAVRTPSATPAPVHAPAPKSAGLLGDTSAFRHNPERPGTWTWTKPGVDLRHYDDLLIEEIRVTPAEGSALTTWSEADRAAEAQALKAALLKTVAPYYEVVEVPSEHTLRVRVTLTSLPAADGTGAASVEAELLDGHGQERLVGALGALSAEELKPAEGSAATPVERAHQAWAARLLRYLDTHVR